MRGLGFEREQERYWEHSVSYRRADHPVSVAYARPKCDLIERYVDLPPGATALDVGTGSGTVFFSLAQRYRSVGIDSSRHLLRQHCARGRVVLGDARRLPHGDMAFDLVVESCVLHHCREPADIVTEMARVARRAICLIEPNMLNPPSLLFHAVVREERGALRISRAMLKATIPREFQVAFEGAVGLVFPKRTPAWLLPVLRVFDRAWALGNVHVIVATRQGTSD